MGVQHGLAFSFKIEVSKLEMKKYQHPALHFHTIIYLFTSN